ncbi:MAG: thermostable hemolysin [Pseudohongiella sp.]|jgi:hypothetical protein|nr:thermostable hemolysin [Pseudohongiella sp.]
MHSSVVEKIDQSEQFMPMKSRITQLIRPVPAFDLVQRHSSLRPQVEAYIESKFKASYGATPSEYLPLLLTLRCVDQLSGAAGISIAALEERLFLEQYLDLPVEQVLQQTLGSEVQRQGIVEIGNLVATTNGASRIIFIVLASVLYQAGFEWMVFTATKPLLAGFKKLGFENYSLGKAELARLSSDSAESWGSYYQNKPEVVAGRLSCAMDIIQSRKLFKCVQTLYKSRIDSLSAQIRQQLPEDVS